MKSTRLLRILLILGISTATFAQALEVNETPLQLTLAGDSTMAGNQASSGIHGWGEFLAPRLRPRVRVHNLAARGASSASFLSEGRWAAVLADHPAVIIIQFGHNDLFQQLGTAQFIVNLRRFVATARAQGAVPILVTPVQLRIFRRGNFVPTLTDFADATRQVATETGAPLVDLNALSGELFTRLGPGRVEQLGSPQHDNTHFNALGSQALAEIVLRELASIPNPLRREILPSTPAPVATPAKARRR